MRLPNFGFGVTQRESAKCLLSVFLGVAGFCLAYWVFYLVLCLVCE